MAYGSTERPPSPLARTLAAFGIAPRRWAGAEAAPVPPPGLGKPGRRRRAERYLRDAGMTALFLGGDPAAIPPKPTDLAFLHKTVRRLRPRTILEFGSGHSTLAMAYALRQNQRAAADGADAPPPGRLFVVEANRDWLAHTEARLPHHLRQLVDLRVSAPEVMVLGGELCHAARDLPDIVPDLIFLDGPGPADIVGSHRGLSFLPEDRERRSQVAADPLFYESSLKPGAMIVVDGRLANTWFLRRTLRRTYRFRLDAAPGLHTFTLVR